MEEKNKIEKERKQIDSLRFISIAVLAGAFAIITTLLQVDVKTIAQSQDLKKAITIFCLTIPYLVIDIHFLNIEQVDGKKEHFLFKRIRVFFWILTGIGIGFAFNYLPNILHFSNGFILLSSFLLFFILKSSKIFIEEFLKLHKRPKDNNKY